MTAPSSRARATAARRCSTRQHATVRIAGAVEPHEGGVLRPLRRVVGCHGSRPRERRPDRVRRVRHPGVHDGIPRPHAEHEGQQCDELLRSDRGDDVGGREVVDSPPAREPLDDGLAQGRAAGGLRVGVRIRGRGERRTHDGRGRIDGRADGEIDDPVGVGPRALPVRRERVPREVRERQRRAGHYCAPPPSTGIALMSEWSSWMSPTFEAPPGEPKPVSSKNSTLAV